MKIRALVSFAAVPFSMARNEVREVEASGFIASLISCGYAIEEAVTDNEAERSKLGKRKKGAEN